MNVYLVSYGEYSDYHIVGVFSTKELAKLFVRRHPECRIEEPRRLDSYEEQLRGGMVHYVVAMARDGTSSTPYPSTSGLDGRVEEDDDWWPKPSKHHANPTKLFHVWALNSEHATKIANERRIKLLAEEQFKVPL